VYVHEKLKKIKRTTRSLAATLGREPSSRELARELGSAVAWVETGSTTPDTVSLEDIASDSRLDRVTHLTHFDESEAIAQADRREVGVRVRQALQILDPRAATVVRMRFGIDRAKACTLEEIGRFVGLSRERVRQIQDAALSQIMAHEARWRLRELAS
jgi:RNA polymerase primary sigma factor